MKILIFIIVMIGMIALSNMVISASSIAPSTDTKSVVTVLNEKGTPINDLSSCIGEIYDSSLTGIDKFYYTYLSKSNGIYYSDYTSPSEAGKYTIDGSCYDNNVNLTYYFKDSFDVQEITSAPATVSDTSEIKYLAKQIKYISDRTKFGIGISGTDYELGQDANYSLAVKVHDTGIPINDAFCNAQIFFPNETILQSFSLHYLNNSRGMYKYSNSLPNVTGVFPVDVECSRPFIANEEVRFFVDETQDKELSNYSSSVSTLSTIEQVSTVNGLQCLQRRFTETLIEAGDEWTPYRFLESIKNASIWVNSTGVLGDSWDLILNFYRVTDKGTVKIGAMSNDTTRFASTPIKVSFKNINIESVWDGTSSLQVEFCARKVSGGARDLSFLYNSSTFDSKFYVVTGAVNSTVDFIVQGSSELNIKNGTNKILNNPVSVSINNTAIAESVWNFGTRTLTAFNFAVNVTQQVLDNIASSIWNFTYRTLTAFGFTININDANIIGNITSARNYFDLQIANNFTFADGLITSGFNGLNLNIFNNFTYTNSLIHNESVGLSGSLFGNFTATNTLISSNFATTNSYLFSINGTIISVNATLPEDVWKFPDRTVINVTFTTLVENVTNILNAVNVSDISDGALDDIALRVILHEMALHHIVIKQ